MANGFAISILFSDYNTVKILYETKPRTTGPKNMGNSYLSIPFPLTIQVNNSRFACE